MPYVIEHITCPVNSMVYNEHSAEVSLDELLGEDADWNTELIGFDHEADITPPAGWTITGWDTHAHKDALGIITFYFEPVSGECANPEGCASPEFQ